MTLWNCSLCLGGQGRGGADRKAQRGHIVLVPLREVEETDKHGWHAGIVGHLVGLDRLEHVRHVARVGDLDHGDGVGDADVHAHGQAVAVKVGHDGQEDVLRLPALDPDVQRDGIGDQVVVAELGALGAAGGAAGVDQGRDLVGIDLYGRRSGACCRPIQDVLEPVGVGVGGDVDLVALFFLLGQGEEELEQAGEILFDVGHDHAFQAGVAPDALDAVVELAHYYKGLRARILEQVLDLAVDVERVAAYDDAADAPGGIGGDDKLGAVGQHDGHPVALADAQVLQSGGEAVHGIVQLLVGQIGVHQARTDHGAKDGGGLVGVLGRRVRQQPVQRDAGVVDGGWYPFVVVLEPGFLHVHPP